MKNTKLWDWVVWNERLKTKIKWKIVKIIEYFMLSKNFIFFLVYVLMGDISVEKYTNAKVCTIRMSNKKLFWVIMYDVQEGTGVKNVSDLVREKKLGVFLELKIQQKIKSENIKDVKKNWIIILLLLLCMFVVISCPE